MQSGGQAGHGRVRIHHSSAKNAGVQVNRRPFHDDFHASYAAQPVSESAESWADHARIGNRDHIALQFFPVLLEERLQIGAADLLFAFNEENQVHRQIAVRGHRFLKAPQVAHELAFVVRGTTAVNAAIAEGGLKGRGLPFIQRLGRLHIVVRIDHHGATAGLMDVARQNHRMARRFVNPGAESDGVELGHQPVGAGADIALVGRIGGNTGEPQQCEKVVKSWRSAHEERGKSCG